jgi:predicted CXXCH cytochrome family protein
MKKNHLIKLGAGLAMALGMAAATHAAGIADTKHNLSTTGTQSVHQTSGGGGTAEICVFCHTPHGANTSVAAPLWNKPTNGGTYTVYDVNYSSTIDGTVDMGGVSLACLSCHDGAQAMDTMINKPGSGGWIDGTTGSAFGGTWTGSADGKMPAGIANLGTSLTNDHPVGIQYCGGGIIGGGGSCADGDFFAPTEGSIGGGTFWWIETGGNATRSKTDLPLYGRTVSGTFQPMVECASCHDPHTTGQATFLRISNAGSALCLSCHNK